MKFSTYNDGEITQLIYPEGHRQYPAMSQNEIRCDSDTEDKTRGTILHFLIAQ
jgi:hypothetical protein